MRAKNYKFFIRIEVLLLLFFLSLYLLAMNGRFSTSMDVEVYRTAMSLVEDGDFGLKEKALASRVGVDGKHYCVEGLAVILVATPFIFFSKLTGIPPHNLVILMNQILTPIVCLLIFLLGRELRYSVRTSILLAFVYGAGTMAFVHSKYMLPEPLFSVAFLSAVLFLFKYRKLRKVQYLLLSGCFAGVTILIRADAVLFIFGMSIGVAATLLKNYRTGNSSLTALIREVFFFVVPLLFFFSVFFYYNYSRFGNILETGYTLKNEGQIATLSYTSRFLNVKNTLGGFWGMWVIPCRSIFFINPVLVFVFFSLKEFWKKFKYESIVLLIIFAMYTFLYMNRGPKGFPGSAAWGARYMLPMVSFMVLPIGVFVENIFREKNDSLKKVFFSIFVISFVFQLIGSSINYQKVQMPLENVYKKLYNDPSMARLKLTTDPRWNLVYQNLKVLKTGRVDVKEKGQIYSFRVGRDSDFMFYNYLRRGNVPDWVIISLFFIITTLLTSGYLLFKPLLLPVKEPVRKEKFKGKKKKKRR